MSFESENHKKTKMKNRMIYILLAVFTAGVLSSCEKDFLCIEGIGPDVTDTLQVDTFTGIRMLGAENVEISWGEEQLVVVTGHENIINRIRTGVRNGVWDMELEKGNYLNYNLKYFITLPRINEITNEGASRVYVNDFTNEGDLEININGAGKITLDRMENTENMYVTIDGLGHVITMDEFPSLKYLDIYINGAGDFLGFPAITNECRIEIDGAAKCEVHVESKLEVYIDGTGTVSYRGDPSVYQEVSGLGRVEKQN